MDRLLSIARKLNIDLKRFLKKDTFRVFQLTAEIPENPNALERLLFLASTFNRRFKGTNIAEDAISANHYALFRSAVSAGNTAAVELLIEEIPHLEIEYILIENDCDFFRKAVSQGYIGVFNRLLEAAPSQVTRNRMMRALTYEDWTTQAVLSGDFSVISELNAAYPSILQENILSFFRRSIQVGNLAVLERLMALAPNQVRAIIEDNDFKPFRRAAAQNGDLHFLELLITIAPNQVPAMIAADNFGAFRTAASNGHLHALERLIAIAPNQVPAMIVADSFGAFRDAASNGHLHVIERLIELAPNQVPAMIAADSFVAAVGGAASNGHLDVLERFIEIAPNHVQAMVATSDFLAFRLAARNGHLSIIGRLIELAPNQVQAMVASNHFEALTGALLVGHLPIVHRLLAFDNVFAQAEMHVHEHGPTVHDFLQSTLVALRDEKARFTQAHPEGVFDVEESKGEKALPLIAASTAFSIEALIETKRKLSTWGGTGGALLAEIQCLEIGMNSSWNILWRGAENKLGAIIEAIKPLSRLEDLNVALTEDASALSIALSRKLGPRADKTPDEKPLGDIRLSLSAAPSR